MDFELWLTDNRRSVKESKLKDSEKQRRVDDLNAIEALVDEDITPSMKTRVRLIETDGVILIGWRIRDEIHHYVVSNGSSSINRGEIRERGVETWPRGETKKLDDLCSVLDTALVGDAKSTSQAVDVFLSKHGTITPQQLVSTKKAKAKVYRRRK